MSTTQVADARALMMETPLEWAKITLRGIGQIMFQENALTGLLFLTGIALAGWEETWWVSLWMAFGCLAGAALGTATAWLLRYGEGDIRAGIYGFNGSLVGIATFFFFAPSPATIAFLVVWSILSTIVTWAMRTFLPFPTYTFPFVATTWVAVGIAVSMGMTRIDGPVPVLSSTNFVEAFTEGLSEVMLQASVVTGIFFLAGLAVSNWRHAVLGFVGSLVGTLVGIYHNDMPGAISIGIYGYNGALAAIAMDLPKKALVLPVFAAILSTPITEAFGVVPPPIPGYTLPALTGPFVFASWAALLLVAMERYFVGERPGHQAGASESA